jgi:hypothetical protein
MMLQAIREDGMGCVDHEPADGEGRFAMSMTHNLGIVAVAVLLVNLPFGFWREGVRKFSLNWFVAVHAPVPLVVGLRVLSGLGWHLATFPVLVGAFFAGQLLGGKLRRWWQPKP